MLLGFSDRVGIARSMARLGSDRRGGVALIFAMSVPILAVLAAGAIDLAWLHGDRQLIQDALDEAALRGAQQQSASDEAALAERTQAYLNVQLARLQPRIQWTASTKVDRETGAVTVKVDGSRMSFFGNL